MYVIVCIEYFLYVFVSLVPIVNIDVNIANSDFVWLLFLHNCTLNTCIPNKTNGDTSGPNINYYMQLVLVHSWATGNWLHIWRPTWGQGGGEQGKIVLVGYKYRKSIESVQFEEANTILDFVNEIEPFEVTSLVTLANPCIKILLRLLSLLICINASEYSFALRY